MGLVKDDSALVHSPLIDQPISSNEIAVAKQSTFLNRTAVSPQTYPEIYGTLLSYSDGSTVIVEYFHKRVSYINNQTLDTGLSLELASVHNSYDLIHNFELSVQDQLTIEIDPETNETTITGEAFAPAGFKANPGDLLYLRLPDDQIGVFSVDLATPMSIHKGTCYKLNFHLYSYLTDAIDDKLRASIAEEFYFDTQHYFGDEVALLTSTSYNQLNQLLQSRQDLIKYITTKFYKLIERTLICPEDIFDTYVVEFVNNKISTKDTRLDICQLSLTFIDDFDHTIFAAILNQDITQLVHTGYMLSQYQNFLWDTNISSMDGYRAVRVTATGELTSSVRSTMVKFNITDLEPSVKSYYFSNRFYYSLIRSFESGETVTDVTAILADMATDSRIYPNLYDTFYSVHDDAYHDLAYFNIFNKLTGSNNDMHLPELEYVVFKYLLDNDIDINQLTTKILPKFPFAKMRDTDKFFYFPTLLHLIDVAVVRLR